MSRRLMVTLAVLSAACVVERSSSDVSAPAGGAGLAEAAAVQLVSMRAERGDPTPAFARRPLSGVRDVTSFAWVVPVQNPEDRDASVRVTLRFVDSRGGEVYRLERSTHLPGGARSELRGEWLALPSEAFRIAGLQVSAVSGNGEVLFSGAAVEVVE